MNSGAIPSRWRERLVGADQIISLADGLLELANESDAGPRRDSGRLATTPGQRS